MQYPVLAPPRGTRPTRSLMYTGVFDARLCHVGKTWPEAEGGNWYLLPLPRGSYRCRFQPEHMLAVMLC